MLVTRTQFIVTVEHEASLKLPPNLIKIDLEETLIGEDAPESLDYFLDCRVDFYEESVYETDEEECPAERVARILGGEVIQ